jgi:carbamoyl-phosphate synthase large subunit
MISSAGRRVSLIDAFRTAVRRTNVTGRVLATDMSRSAPAFHHADAAFQVPRCTAPDFVDRLLALCLEHDVRLLIPTLDTELPVLAEHRARFESQGTVVAVSGVATIAVAYDKVQTHRWLVGEGFPTVSQCDASDVHTLNWTFPTLVKPVRGSCSIGVAIVNDIEALKHATTGGDYVAQSIATGNEYTIDTFVGRDGRCLGAIPRRRLEVRAGEVSKGMTVRNSKLESLAREISERLPAAFGPLNVQVFWDEGNGTAQVIEINPRFGGGFPLSFAAGSRQPEMLIALARGSAPGDDDEWRDRLAMLRYDEAIFVPEEELGAVHEG